MTNLQIPNTERRLPLRVGLSDMTKLLYLSPEEGDPELPERRAILDILLTSTVVLSNDSIIRESSIWVREASNRSISIVELTLLLERFRPHYPRHVRRTLPSVKAACRLAADYRRLMQLSAMGALPCEMLLTGIVSGLLKSFGLETGRLALTMNVHHVQLEAPRRAALALIVSEMVISALKDSVERECGGKLLISLVRTSSEVATLTVAIPHTLSLAFSSSGYEIVTRLAGILKSELVVREINSGGTKLELEFACAE
jgi:hypothetical protein